MSKRIILLSDGTGNSAGKVWRTNVWRIFEGLDLTGPEQVACYDDGVGTSSFKPFAILGGVFGWGLKRNVLTLYEFLSRNYNGGDEVYGFGFSRGAFTIRVLMGLVLNQGLVEGVTDAELHTNAKLAYRAYRKDKFKSRLRLEVPLRLLRDGWLSLFGTSSVPPKKASPGAVKIKFLGLWDTVAAYGTPIDEMTRGISQWIWPLELPNRHFAHESIERACHALSIDDERTTFHPVLWNEKDVPKENISQVWFAGVHSNVGGGYPDDSLAYIPLYWIMQEAQAKGLKFKASVAKEDVPTIEQDGELFDPDVFVHARSARDKDGRLYNSRSGLGGYYRYGPRKIEDLNHQRFSGDKDDFVDIERVRIHESVIRRAREGAHAYAPIGLPSAYDVLTDDGLKPQGTVENDDDVSTRCGEQEKVWNTVWQRRVVYFLTVFSTIYLVIYPLAQAAPKADEYTTRLTFVAGAIRLIGQVLPGFLSPWIDGYARDPSHFLIMASLVGFLIWLGSSLGNQIQSRMQAVWRPSSSTPAQGKTWKFLFVISGILAAGAVLYPLIHFAGIKPPSLLDAWLQDYVTIWIRITLAILLTALLLPESAIQWLRTRQLYKNTVRFLKLEFAPGLIALFLVLLGFAFANRFIFSLEEAAGLICTESPVIANLREKKQFGKIEYDYGIGSCASASIASCRVNPETTKMEPICTTREPVVCSEGSATCTPAGLALCRYGPATCPAKCEEPQIIFDTRSLCTATGKWVEEGQKYTITVVPDKTKWKDGDRLASTRGYNALDIQSLWQRLLYVVAWPLKRDYTQSSFRIVARIGSTGGNEEFLLPDPVPAERTIDQLKPEDERLEVPIQPKSSGELFLYINDAVVAVPYLEDFFYHDNVGTAKVKIRRARQ
jgi:type VI secretion system (T6SS) phospholipase Tle1-like effector